MICVDELMFGEFFLGGNKKKSSGSGGGGGGDRKLKATNDDDDDDDDDDSGGSSSEEGSDENDWAGSDEDSDGEEEDDGGQYMLDLLNNLDNQVSTSSSNNNSKKKKGEGGGGGGKIKLNNASSEAAVYLPESEYHAGALSAIQSSTNDDNDDANNNGDGKLTLDSLMGGIADTSGFATVQKSMRALSSGLLSHEDDNDGKSNNNKKKKTPQKKLETTKAPVSRVISDRASRKVHYESTTNDVSRWKDAIHEQRDAETLDFRTNKGGATTNRITRDTLVEKFEATNEFEKELQSALEKAGMEDEKMMSKREKQRLTGEEEEDDDNNNDGDNFDSDVDDDLGSNRITLQEYKKRHGELAKLRALMFYEEQKRHRINKIKSKKYRKIRKRQRDRHQEAENKAAHLDDPATAEREQIEREEMDRMKERMTLAHKNTSKWARHVLRRGKNMDVEERRALSLQIAKGNELRRKVMGEDGDGTLSDDDDEETEESLLKKAREILMENEDDEDNDGDGKGKKKGLFQLEFMKRGMEAQRTRAKEEARKLLEELEANEMAAMSSADDSDNDNGDKQKKMSGKKKLRVATEDETNKVLPEGKLVASSLQFGKADSFAIKVDGNIELRGNDGDIDKAGVKDNQEETDKIGRSKSKRRKKKNQGAKENDETPAANNREEEEEENPWIVSKSAKKLSKPLSRTVNVQEAASMLVDTVQAGGKNAKRKRDDEKNTIKEDTAAANQQTSATEKEVGVAELSQEELVRRAFAAPADLEAEEEFQKEKVSLILQSMNISPLVFSYFIILP